MCGKGGGSPPVPSGSSTAFQSTVSPAAFATPLYQDFLNRANTLSSTPFNPAMQGSVAALTPEQTFAGGQLYSKGLEMGNFDPNAVAAIQSPFTQQVVNATQNWFNNQNAIQANDLLSQGIRSGNAFGGDRAGVAEGVLAGQQQLAQAPVIAGLYQSGYGQALQEYNTLKQMGMQGAQAALGWGSLEQAQKQRELDVAQQNAMMESAYPFQTLNWYGAILGGIAPLLGSQAVGYNTPPTPGGAGFKRGGMVLNRRAQGGLVPVFIRHKGGLIPGLAYGGSSDSDEDEDKPRSGESREPPSSSSQEQPDLPERERSSSWGSEIGQLKTGARQLPQPTFPSGGAQQPQSTAGQIGEWAGTLGKVIDVGSKVAPFLAVMSDPSTKTDVQRVGKTDGGDPLYAFRYRGDPKTYPKVVGPMARPVGGMIPRPRRYDDGGDVDEPLTMRDLGVLSDSGQALPESIAGPVRGSPAGNPVQAEDMPNLARVRERFKPALESDPALAKRFDINTTAEVGTRPQARAAYQALTMDRAAARGEPLGKTITDPRYYPPETLRARDASGQGVSPSLWGGANPANFATGNASYDPRTGRWVGFAGGPQTGSVATGSGTETVGIEGPDLAAARRYGYTGPSRTATGPSGPQGTGDQTTPGDQGPASREAGPRGPGGMGPVGGKIPGAPGVLGGITDTAKEALRNPLLQFAGAYLSGTSPWGRVNLGNALLKTAGIQEAQRAADRKELLDQKPEMLNTDKGIAYRYPDGRIEYTGLKQAGSAMAEQKFAAEGAQPIETKKQVPGDFGTQRTETEYWQRDPNDPSKLIPFQRPEAPAAAPQQQAPAPGGGEQPATGVGNAPVRQTEAQPAPAQAPGGGGGTAAAPDSQPGGGAAAAAPAPRIAGPEGGQQVLTPPENADPKMWGPVAQAWQSGAVKPGGAPTDQAARNNEALDRLNERERRIVQDMVDYKIDPNKHFPGVKNADTKRAAIDAAKQYDPSYDPASFANKQAARKAYEATGVEARNFQSNDMAIQHLGRAMDNVEGLNNIGGRLGADWVNDLRRRAKTQIPGFVDQEYKSRLAMMKVDLDAVSTELAKSFRGAGSMAQREIMGWQEKMKVATSPEEMRSVLREGAVLLSGRLEANASRYNEVMGPAYARPAESWLSPKGQETLRRAFAIDPQKPIPPAGGARQQGPEQPQPQQQPQLGPEDQAAVDWARKNPQHPRAKDILRSNGLQ